MLVWDTKLVTSFWNAVQCSSDKWQLLANDSLSVVDQQLRYKQR